MKKLTEEQQEKLRALLTALWERLKDKPASDMHFVYQDDEDWLKSMGAATVHLAVLGNWRIMAAWFTEKGEVRLWRHPVVRFERDDEWLWKQQDEVRA